MKTCFIKWSCHSDFHISACLLNIVLKSGLENTEPVLNSPLLSPHVEPLTRSLITSLSSPSLVHWHITLPPHHLKHSPLLHMEILYVTLTNIIIFTKWNNCVSMSKRIEGSGSSSRQQTMIQKTRALLFAEVMDLLWACFFTSERRNDLQVLLNSFDYTSLAISSKTCN